MIIRAARFTRGRLVALTLVCLACSRGTAAGAAADPAPNTGPEDHASPPQADPIPIEPAREAFLSGWMPLDPTGVPRFAERYPQYDGRGVIIAILDSGLDTDVAGFRTTSTGDAKVLDLRDFSGEGRIPLDPVTATGEGDVVTVGSRSLTGFGRVVSHSISQEYFAGRIAEIPLGTPLVVDPEAPPASDLNGNGRYQDTLVVIVTRAQNGWVLFADTDGDGSLSDERPVHDYLMGHQTFGWATGPDGRPPLAIAANFSEHEGRPVLGLMFDTSGHGTHVAGIAAGHDMYGIEGFDGVAPGARLLGLKIANNARGGITVDGSMERALAYAVAFGERRRMPLVINLSFGVGNEREGSATIDRFIDSLLARHPGVVMTVSAGNDGPGLSTMGFPGSALRPITVGATFPLVFLARPANGPVPEDPMAFFSARGGKLAKPDVVAPGVAYSTVPRWDTGNERNGGTSMAAPHVAGLAARLLSAAAAEETSVAATAVKRALMVTAMPLPGNSFVDQGTGVPDLPNAWRWLQQAVTRGEGGDGGETGVPGTTVAQWTIIEEPSGTATEQVHIPAVAAMGPWDIETTAPWVERPHSAGSAGGFLLDFAARRDSIAPGTARTALITGWGGGEGGADRSGGPVFRVVYTAVNPLPAGQPADLGPLQLDPGATERLFFRAEEGRPFQVRIETGGVFQRMYTSLHQPGGAPYLGENGIPAGPQDDAAVYQVDGRDVVAGIYQMATAGSPVAPGKVAVRLRHAPFRLAAHRTGGEVQLIVTNLSAVPQKAKTRVALLGAVRRVTIQGAGGEERRLSFTIPAWAHFMELDVSLTPDDWSRFTDYGVTVLDELGRVVADGPLNYATGRIRQVLGPAHADLPVVVSLMPGLADTADTAPWEAAVAVRFYAGSAVALEASAGVGGVEETSVIVSLPSGKTATTTFVMRPSPWELGSGFVPLGIAMTETQGPTWTREVALPPPPETR